MYTNTDDCIWWQVKKHIWAVIKKQCCKENVANNVQTKFIRDILTQFAHPCVNFLFSAEERYFKNVLSIQ